MTGGAALEERLRARLGGGGKLLVPYLTVGYPDPATTSAALVRLAEAGADAIEVGVPFSDPLADGPTIAAAAERAIAGGASLAGAIAIGRGYRSGGRPPLVLFSYLNPVAARGVRETAEACREAGFGGALVADLPFDEDPRVEAAFEAADLALVRLAAPTTPAGRLERLGCGARGFVYLIARTGVTGAGAGTDDRVAAQVRILRSVTRLPIVVGFGIGDRDGARRAATLADGIVVGSALVERLARDGVERAVEWFGELRVALDAG